ncbi:MAG: hypothetical protein EX260_12290 [Desulfobulbaceae bacterium]|nr:MAG: hypothetical protein EX260_12290 [Desulfobulbaceae bacterium]
MAKAEKADPTAAGSDTFIELKDEGRSENNRYHIDFFVPYHTKDLGLRIVELLPHIVKDSGVLGHQTELMRITNGNIDIDKPAQGGQGLGLA